MFYYLWRILLSLPSPLDDPAASGPVFLWVLTSAFPRLWLIQFFECNVGIDPKLMAFSSKSDPTASEKWV
jgi:hypothetical protein